MKKILSIIILVSLIMVSFIQVALAAEKQITEADKNELKRMAYAEALNQKDMGIGAVILVAINRFENNHGKYSMAYITRRSQFAKAGKWILTSKDKKVKAAVERISKLVDYALDNRILPSNCTMFQRANKKHWQGRPKILRYCRIGAHTFYTNGSAKEVTEPQYIDMTGKLVTKGADNQ